MPKDDCQSFFKVLTQISPAEETFGWKILVANQPDGGASASCGCVGSQRKRPTFWWCSRELAREAEFYLEVTAGVWCTLCKRRGKRMQGYRQGPLAFIFKSPPTWSFDNPSNVKHIIFIRDDANSFRWICSEFVELLHEPTKYGWRDGLFPSQ